MDEWQSIETAPKDGTDILASTARGLMVVVSWLDPTAGDRAQGVPSEPEFGWYMSDGHNDPIHFRAWMSLISWQPLPEPPALTPEA